MLKIFNYTNNKINHTQSVQKTNAVCFGINSSNLAPLEHDTVSFGSRKKTAADTQRLRERLLTTDACDEKVSAAVENILRGSSDKKLENKTWTISYGLANRIHGEAKNNTTALDNCLSNVLKPLRPKSGLCSSQYPIFDLEFRTKKPGSIREKASQKNINTFEGCKDRLTDLTGARIILDNNMGTKSKISGADRVLMAISEAVKEGKLKVVEVESHSPADKKYQYGSQTTLRKLARESSGKFGIDVKERSTVNESGYMGIHILVRFPNGYAGEIQILGKDVAEFKELEDLTHKLLLGKEPGYKKNAEGKKIKPNYTPIRKVMEPVIIPVGADTSDPEIAKKLKLKREFVLYTEAAYKHEREKGSSIKRKDADMLPEFLTLEEFSGSSRKKIHLKPELDFNNLYKLKAAAENK